MAEDLTLEVLKQIRDELREVKEETRSNGQRLDRVVQEQIRHATAIVGLEASQRELVEGQRAVVEELRTLNRRVDNVLTGPVGSTVKDTASRVEALESRMTAVEKRIG